MKPQTLRALQTLFVAATLTAPCASALAQLPDFTGLWESYRGAAQARGSGFGGRRADLPLTEEGERLVEEYRILAGPMRLNGATFCANYGVPGMMSLPGSYPLEFIQKPDQVTLIFEVNNETRRIYIRDEHLPPEQRLPSRQGYSAGHWEGSVLVVETTALMDGQDQSAFPYSERATIHERFSLDEDANGTPVLTWEATINDPVYYTEPVSTRRQYEPYDGFIIPYGCQDELWYELLDARRDQLNAGEPVEARMSDIYEAREAAE